MFGKNLLWTLLKIGFPAPNELKGIEVLLPIVSQEFYCYEKTGRVISVHWMRSKLFYFTVDFSTLHRWGFIYLHIKFSFFLFKELIKIVIKKEARWESTTKAPVKKKNDNKDGRFTGKAKIALVFRVSMWLYVYDKIFASTSACEMPVLHNMEA